ncbi:MAG: SPFH domain-containing protein, partial [Firmicutes bacterium]|nr:SPFH domain-containing protein [Bacillota bacterium]
MNEIILNKSKNGMAVLIGVIALYILAFFLLIGAGVSFVPGPLRALAMIVCILWLAFGWILLLGLKVIRPQEALVLTLFGKYVGTLKGEGFYHVNPFCVAVNPAAKTRLSQSGDVDSGEKTSLLATMATGKQTAAEMPSKKVSLKVQTL